MLPNIYLVFVVLNYIYYCYISVISVFPSIFDVVKTGSESSTAKRSAKGVNVTSPRR